MLLASQLSLSSHRATQMGSTSYLLQLARKLPYWHVTHRGLYHLNIDQHQAPIFSQIYSWYRTWHCASPAALATASVSAPSLSSPGKEPEWWAWWSGHTGYKCSSELYLLDAPLPSGSLYFEKAAPYFLLFCHNFTLGWNLTQQQHSLSHQRESLSEPSPLLK